ncbi:MAG: hypothetical protein H0T47_21220 [Planctomycetaceae bacterium]|nr:hypothetical protein [Planctomycetaceae bacterium]
MRLVPPKPAARAAIACALAASALSLSGCKSSPFTNYSEKRAVNGFAQALADADNERLRAMSSSHFATAVLSDESSIAEVKQVWPIKGKLEVVSVKEVEEFDRRDPDVPEKLVTIKDERKWKTDQRLVQDPKTKKWVVDEILITHSQKGLKATKTVSEQVMFISVVRDFADAWRNKDRERRLAGVTEQCRAELEPLPDEVLDNLAGRMFPANTKDPSPDATMDDDIAIVRLARAKGAVLLQLKRIDGKWLVDDAAFDAGKEGENIASLRKTAVAYASAAKFLGAYAANDRDLLKSLATKTFYDATLSAADLSSVALPPAAAGENGQLKIVGRQAELVIDEGTRMVKVALVRTDDESDVKAMTEFRIEDVTIYEEGGTSKRRLAAALVAEPMAQLYADALVARDLPQLRVMGTHDFNERAWRHITDELVPSLPLGDIQPGDREVLSVVHNGAATDVTMMQAGRAVTYVMRDEGGAVKVDDVLVAVADRPSSLKATMAQMLPVLRVKAAIAAGNVEALRRDCSVDFNRLIWTQVRNVPPQATAAVRFLDAPLTAMTVQDTTATVQLGDSGYGGLVTLLEQDGRWKVNEITIVAGPGPADQASLKSLLREGIANGTLYADAAPAANPAKSAAADGTVRQVGYDADFVAPSSDAAKEPRPLDLGLAPETLPPAADTAPAPAAMVPRDESALPFEEPLW